MSTVIDNQQLTQQYSLFINDIPNEFYIKGQCKLPQISIKHQLISYSLQYPISKCAIADLKQIATLSLFGHGIETIYDANIRNSFELNATQFNIENFNLLSTNNKYLESIRKCLLPDIDNILCEPYKVLIYETGSFFKSHVDTPTGKNHFGTLIISLPCDQQYEGGEFVLSFNDKQIIWKPTDCCEYIAFYSDIIHEIKPITKGHRIVITFNLMIPTNIKDKQYEKAIIDQSKWIRDKYYVSDYFYSTPRDNIKHSNENQDNQNDDLNKLLFDILLNCDCCKELHLPEEILWIILEFIKDSKVINSIQTIFNEENFHPDICSLGKSHENVVLIIFEHIYQGKHINPLSLKGRDMYLYKTFKKYFGVYLTSVTVCSVIGKWSDEYYDYDYDVRGIGPEINEWDETDNKTEWKIRLDDRLPNILKAKIGYQSKFIVLYNNKQQSLIHAKFVNGGAEYYGNVGTYDLENQYHCTGLLLTKYDPIQTVLTTPTPTATKQNNCVYVCCFVAGLFCAIGIYYLME